MLILIEASLLSLKTLKQANKMSRNPYLAASRPSSSYTRSSRSSAGRSTYGTGASGGSSGYLARSKSSASLSSQLNLATGSSYLPTYVPFIPSWQRSSSASRAGSDSTRGKRYGESSGRETSIEAESAQTKQNQTGDETDVIISSALFTVHHNIRDHHRFPID